MTELPLFLGAVAELVESSWSPGPGFWAILLVVGGMAVSGTGEILWQKFRFPILFGGGEKLRGWGPEWLFMLSRAMGGVGAISMFIGVVFASIWFVD